MQRSHINCIPPCICQPHIFPRSISSSLNSISGPPGPPGLPGKKGEKGDRGPQGPAGSGENIVGQNVGTEGIGVYVGKINDTLQFRNIASTNAISLNNQSNNIVISPIIGGTSNTLAPGNDPRFATPNLIQVKNSNPGFGEFSSIAAALSSITDAAENNPYLIQVGPGIYTEPELVVPSWVHVTGSTILPTVVQPDANNHHIFRVRDNTEISFLNLQGAGPGYAAVASLDAGDFTQVFKVSITDSDIGVLVTAETQPGQSYLEYVDINGMYSYGLKIESISGMAISVNTENFYLIPAMGNTATHVLIEGSGAELVTLTANLIGSDDIGIGYQIINGATVKLLGAVIQKVNTGILLNNGANVYINGGFIDSLTNDVFMENVGSGSNLVVRAMTTSIRAKNTVRVEHPNGRGRVEGLATSKKIFIHPTADFDVIDRKFNTITVGKRDSMFTSVSQAINSINPTVTAMITSGSTTITSNSLFNVTMSGFQISGPGIPNGTIFSYQNELNGIISNAATLTGTFSVTIMRANIQNAYSIEIGPGIYVEPMLLVPSFVSVVGANKIVTTIIPQDPNQDAVRLSSFSSLFRLTVQGATGVGAAAVAMNDTTFTEVRDCLFQNSYILIKQVGGSTTPRITSVTDCLFVGSYTYGIYLDGSITSGVSQSTLMVIRTLGIVNQSSSSSTDVLVFGPYASLNQSGSAVQGNGLDTMLQLYDGARVKFIATNCSDVNIGITIPNIGMAPNIQVSSVVIVNSTSMDINIEHQGTTGVIEAAISRTKTFIDPLAPLSLTYVDPVDPGLTIVGSLNIGPTNTSAVDVQPLIYRSAPIGVMEGGEITDIGGLQVAVTGGLGYVEEVAVEQRLLYINWNNTNLTLSPNSTFNIYVSNTSTVEASTTPPPLYQSIRLGRVRTGPTSIEFIESSRVIANHPDNLDDRFRREALGPLYVSGSVITTNASRQIAVSSGRYFYSSVEFNPSGKAFTDPYLAYFHNGGTFTFTSQTVVDNSQYDNGTNLVPLTAGMFTKHSLYIVGEGANEQYMLVYGQAEYTTLAEAEGGFLPVPPTYFTQAVTPIASLVVQEGNSAIVTILSERPFSGVRASFVASTIDHGSLQGLLNDDHPQYLLTNGDRPLTGNLNLNTHDIFNVNTVNGVTVEAHAARHLPNSLLDPLATAAPDVDLSATSTNFVGTANSFARSNHTHAITTGTPSTLQPDQPNAMGTAAALARADHIHEIPTAAPTTTLSATTTNTRGDAATFARSDHTHAINTGPATTLSATTTNTTGTAATLARSDHTHAISIGAASTITPDLTNATGTSANLARADHIHEIPTAAPTTNLSATTTNTQGGAPTFARSDHTHAINTGPATTLTATTTNTTGTATTLARSDHTHAISTGSAVTLSATTTNTTGTAATLARSDHTHAIVTGAASTITPDLANTEGTSTNLARADHIHNIPSGIPVAIGTTNTRGTAASFALSDHVHQGVRSLTANGGTQLFGDISLNSGTGISLTQTGNNINISTATSAGYLQSYDTTNQSVTAANTFQNVIYNTNGTINDWTHTTGTAEFTPTTSGIYVINYMGHVENTATLASVSTITMRATLNNTEIAGSIGFVQLGAVTDQVTQISQTFIVSITAGQILRIQIAGSATTVRLRANIGVGTTRPSTNLIIHRL